MPNFSPVKPLVMRKILIIAFVFLSPVLKGQDTTMLSILNDSMDTHIQHHVVQGTFDGVYLINSETVETPPRRTLLLLIMHRFGQVNTGAYNFFGLDFATMRLGFEYGITDRLSVGIGRSTLDKTFDSHFKWKFFQQKTGLGGFPFTMDLFGGLYYTTLRSIDSVKWSAGLRTSTAVSLIMARKMSGSFSLQLTPSWVRYTLLPISPEKLNLYNLGLGARLKVTKRMDFQAEYNYVLSGQDSPFKRYNSLSMGVDFVTGGHVFQLQLSNSEGMIAPAFIGKTTDSWTKGGIFFGFNISRAFQMGK